MLKYKWITLAVVASLACINISYASTSIAGGSHSLSLQADNTVSSWGYNYYGQLGNNSTSNSQSAVQVSGLTNVSIISAGSYHSVALKTDGTVWAWGHNVNGQLGDNSTIHRDTPVQVVGLTGGVAIASGAYHSMAQKNDGTVWSWGHNGNGQLGNNTTVEHHEPEQVNGLTDVSSIACGAYHSLALKTDGTVWAWGNNENGQIGDNSTINRHNPVQVTGLTGVAAIVAGQYHSIILKTDGTVWAWGKNGNGQIGDNTIIDRHTPVQVSGLSGIMSIAGGGLHSLALNSDGTVMSWGDNNQGQLGDNTTTEQHTPVHVLSLTGVTDIAAGANHSLAKTTEGTVRGWGLNIYGQVGDNPLVFSGDQAPVITLTGGSYIALKKDDDYTDPGATAVDDLDGNITALIQISGSVDTSSIGTYQIVYSVMDSGENSDVKIRTVRVTHQPVAVADTAVTQENTIVQIDILDNDSDEDGSLNVDSIEIVSLSEHGTAEVVNGVISYEPDTHYYGNDSFSYRVRDNDTVFSNSANVTITVEGGNDLPTISDISDQSTYINTGINDISFTINDTDNSVDSLVLAATSSNQDVLPVGNITFGGTGINRTVSILPAGDKQGTSTVVVTVNDGTDSISGSFILSVVPQDIINGDIDGDDAISLNDAIIILQILSGTLPASDIYIDADINGDKQIGMAEIVYVLQEVSKNN